jgi:hypothetical protein
VNAAVRWVLIQVAFVAAFFSAMLLGNIQQITAANLALWCAAAVLTALVTSAMLSGLWWYRIRTTNDRPLTTLGAVTVMAIVGIAFAAMQWASTAALGLTLERDPLLAAVSGALGVTVIGAAVIFLIEGRRVETARRHQLLERATALALARQDVADIGQRMRLALDADIDDALAPARRSIAEQLSDQERMLTHDKWADVAVQLRSAAQETVRPLSRSLWSKTAARLDPIRLGNILRNIITKQPLRPVALAVIYVVANFANAIAVFGWSAGLTLVSVGVAMILIIAGLANLAMRRWPARHAVLFLAGALLLQAGSLLTFPLREWAGLAPYSWAEFVLGTTVGLLVILLTSGAGSLRNHREDVARTFQSDIDRELIESVAASRQMAQLARDSARILHGTVQTRLIACAVAIERAVDTRDVKTFQSALREAYSVLAEPTRLDIDEDTTLEAEVSRKVALWSGLCAIAVEVEPVAAGASGRMARDAGRVVEEGLSNAIRHGGASEIHVAVRGSHEHLEVVVLDNGCGPQGGAPGLGSSLLDSVSDSWTLTSTASGARLSVTLHDDSELSTPATRRIR